MNIHPIKTETDYQATLKKIESLMMARPDAPEGDRLDVLVILVEAYEANNHLLNSPDPVEAIKFTMRN